MTLKLYAHPLSSYCHKALIAFYENDTPFELMLVGDPTKTDPKVWEEFKTLWPIGKFPVLKDTVRDWFVPEATIIIEYLAQHYPGKAKLVPADPDLARRVRMADRFFDNYLHTPMQKINGDKIRPAHKRDPAGVEDAKKMYRTALDMLENMIATTPWVMGDAFTLADCAAAPALFYGNLQTPFDKSHPNVFAYLERLKARPSYARALREAEPYFHLLPK
ncbi:MAG TPA: glutathione S-transferase family protein [Rhizomicrobium sp.]|nr:glutathione S-transferase family protein [Rhizomicrobium sp.]